MAFRAAGYARLCGGLVGLTETGSGSLRSSAGTQLPAAVLVDGSAWRHAAGSSTADDKRDMEAAHAAAVLRAKRRSNWKRRSWTWLSWRALATPAIHAPLGWRGCCRLEGTTAIRARRLRAEQVRCLNGRGRDELLFLWIAQLAMQARALRIEHESNSDSARGTMRRQSFGSELCDCSDPT